LVPHDEITTEDFQQGVIGVALLQFREVFRDTELSDDTLVATLEIEETEGHECTRACNMCVDHISFLDRADGALILGERIGECGLRGR
jgi:hypothetical protein